MIPQDIPSLLDHLIGLPRETEWYEFKVNNDFQEEMGEYISAMANAAALHHQACGYVIWGIEDETHTVVGTKFQPRATKIGNEELENWLFRLLNPQVNFRFYEVTYQDKPVVILEIPAATHTPVRFKGEEFIRVGTYKKRLKDFPEKERELWRLFSHLHFEKGTARDGVTSGEVLSLIDFSSYFELTAQTIPEGRQGILDRLIEEKIIERAGGDKYKITNLGAILFAKNLSSFDGLARKAVRVIVYDGSNRVKTKREQPGRKGYASGFQGLIGFIHSQVPENEHIGAALRVKVPMFPPLAVRELVANALVHQDFTLSGTGPLVEIFEDRIEISNPGLPLIHTDRFIDAPPQSRNDRLAAFLRRVNICEERGSGIDKVVFQAETFQLPAPDFQVTDRHTKAVLYAYRKLSGMSQTDRIRACYQHACLQHVSNQHMTNASLRKRFSISDENYSIASRIIGDTVDAGLIKPFNPDSKSKKHARYVPFWV
jgi:predicted HTH transcriptional regulator